MVQFRLRGSATIKSHFLELIFAGPVGILDFGVLCTEWAAVEGLIGCSHKQSFDTLEGGYVYSSEEVSVRALWWRSKKVRAYDATFPVMVIVPFGCNGLKSFPVRRELLLRLPLKLVMNEDEETLLW
jgi:hypothetical protein